MSDIDYSLSSVDPNDRKGFFSIFGKGKAKDVQSAVSR